MTRLRGWSTRGLSIRGLPLRVRLVAGVLLLALAGLTIAGAATLTSLHSYLVGRVDADLLGTAQPFQHDGDHDFAGPPGDSPPTASQPENDNPRLPSAFWIARYTASGQRLAVYSVLPSGQSPPALSRLTAATVRARAGKPFTVSSVDDSGSWRVLVAPTPDGSGSFAVARSLADVDSTVNHLLLLELAIGGGVLVLMGAGGYVVVRRSLRPLSEIELTAAAIAGGDLSRRVPPGDERTEVGRLAGALNGMLAQIETAFEHQTASEQQARNSENRMRRFVSDASHELRTPLTSIRGFAELFRMGAVGDRRELTRLMQRIETEAARMGVLVEDLLLLARLDEARPVAAEPVDLTGVAADAVHDARLIAPDRKIALTLPGIPAMVTGDDARLRQVAHNLVGNALTHTPAGTAVAVAVGVDGSTARLTVSDEGPGIPAEHLPHLFERFYRADSARSRANGGSGLGLAIVAEIVAAHGGTVDVDSPAGHGTTFTVTLPLQVDVEGQVPQPRPA